MSKLKWPQQDLFRHSTTDKIIETDQNTYDLGITVTVTYFLLYLYIFATAIYAIKDRKIITVSEAYEHCEKRLPTVLLMLFLGLLQGLFIRQNFYTDDIQRLGVVIVNYVIITCWILFFFITPSSTGPHFFLALIVFLSVIYNAVTIYDLYTKYYDKESLETLKIMTYLILVFFGFMVLVMLVHILSIKWMIYPRLTSIAVAISEVGCLISFGIFIIYFSKLPPLLDENDLKCKIIN